MKISILAFGIAKDIFGTSQMEMDLPSSMNAGEFKILLLKKYPKFEKLNSFQLAINANYASDSDMLTPDDEIVVIPPVSGG
jgi:molybdopterin synthase sulfur carrier subunit